MIDPPRVDESAEITMIMPAQASYARVARLGVAAIASRRAFSYDDIEDLRMAVSEAFALLVGDGRVSLRCLLGGEQLTVELEGSDGGDPAEATDLSRQIFAASVDASDIDVDRPRIRLVKTRR